MTWSFLNALKNNPKPTWSELLIDMRNLLKKSNYTQIPQLSSGKEIDLNSKMSFL